VHIPGTTPECVFGQRPDSAPKFPVATFSENSSGDPEGSRARDHLKLRDDTETAHKRPMDAAHGFSSV
jgi:hypothetical protein